MRSMGRALLLLLVVAFVAGVWDARSGEEAAPGRSPAPFGTEPVERDRPARRAPELRSVQADERDGYDRVVFTFEGSMPGYRVRYVPQVTGADGRRVPLRGTAFLEVAFEPARARDPDGTPTFPAAAITPSSPELRQVRFAGDFEGQVSFGLGVAGRGGFRVSELRNPTRVAVDVR
ncbi:MAG: hypothetical protein M3O65_13355 [Actinomycetota bacterium]|nr:hypothetical protein [Actinomycetota bacterium]